MLTLGILFAIVAMIGWAFSDFFVVQAVRKGCVFKTFLWSQVIAVLTYLGIFIFFFKMPIISSATFALIMIAGFFGVILYLAFYKGLQIGYVSVISPIAASGVIIAIILSTIFLGETLTSLQAIGVGFAILGAILTSFKFHDLIKLKLKSLAVGVKYALVAMIAIGIYLVLLDMLVEELGWFLPLLLVKVSTVLYFLVYTSMRKKNLSFPKKAPLFVILVGVFEVIGALSYMAGIGLEFTALVAPISATAPMLTIILARMFLKEMLDTNQKLGVVTVIIGVVLLSI